jgi:hypothetical protein
MVYHSLFGLQPLFHFHPHPKIKFHGKEQSPFSSTRMTEVSTQFILTGGAILNLWDKESMNSHIIIILL